MKLRVRSGYDTTMILCTSEILISPYQRVDICDQATMLLVQGGLAGIMVTQTVPPPIMDGKGDQLALSISKHWLSVEMF
jgi:hypothetical protein